MSDPFHLSDRLVTETVELYPIAATFLGVPGLDHLWPDLGPDGVAARHALVERYRADFARHLDHPDPNQRMAARVAHAYLSEQHEAIEHGDDLYQVAHMESWFEEIRGVFDLMDTSTPEGWDAVCTRLETVERCFDGYVRTLEGAIERGLVSSRRQTGSLAAQARELAGAGSAFEVLRRRAAEAGAGSIEDRLAAAIDHAKEASERFAGFLETRYLAAAPSADGVGEERYRRAADSQVGLGIDPGEVYGWGWEELDRIRRRMAEVADRIQPGAPVSEVGELLERDPARAAPSHAAFLDFVAERQHRALAELDGTHFDIPAPVKKVSVNIAPPGGPLGAYYMAPTEDFARPGGIWYSLPPEDGPVPLYQEVSTAYHEGFPGHHMQIALTMTLAERLSRFQRTLVWYSGYGEGWGLYTERLMDELGYYEKPDYVFGMLASHVFRACRVVVDIGLHLRLDIPAGAPLHPGQPWSFERAVDYLRDIGMQTQAYAESEVLRYLGWPGQAISYKVGEREILALRDEARRRQGGDFDLKSFHSAVLGTGEVRFDTLRDLVLAS